MAARVAMEGVGAGTAVAAGMVATAGTAVAAGMAA
jgi:hypothetical protein